MKKSNIHFANELVELLKPFEQLKLIIHVGTPKTGTTSLQTYLDKKQRKLREKGILYPHSLGKLQNPTAPKHQWFEKNLATAHFEHFLENFKNIISQVKDRYPHHHPCHRKVFITTGGIFLTNLKDILM